MFVELGVNMTSNQYVTSNLESFLTNSKLSLSQAAKKLGISKAYLSQIKNGIRKPSLDTALNIMKFCGVKEREIKRYSEECQKEQSSKYAELLNERETELQLKKLSDQASFKLAKDLDLLNAFEDLYCEGEDGIHKGILIESYGLSIIAKLEYLIDKGVVIRKENRFFVDTTKYHGFSSQSSFKFLKTIIENEEDQFDMGTCLGKSRFDWDDVNEEGYKAMLKTIEDAQNKMKKIAKKHSLSVKDGGKRIAYMNFMSCIQKLLILCVLLVGVSNTDLMAGAGGGGHDPIGGGDQWASIPIHVENPFFEKNSHKEIKYSPILHLNTLKENFKPQEVKHILDISKLKPSIQRAKDTINSVVRVLSFR